MNQNCRICIVKDRNDDTNYSIVYHKICCLQHYQLNENKKSEHSTPIGRKNLSCLIVSELLIERYTTKLGPLVTIYIILLVQDQKTKFKEEHEIPN